MKQNRLNFTAMLFGLAAFLGVLILLIVLIDRRSESVRGGKLPLAVAGQTIPTAWATPPAEAPPQLTGFQQANTSRPAPSPTAEPVPDMLEAATQAFEQPAQRTEMDLPISEPAVGESAP
jgi:hypothetical protein